MIAGGQTQGSIAGTSTGKNFSVSSFSSKLDYRSYSAWCIIATDRRHLPQLSQSAPAVRSSSTNSASWTCTGCQACSSTKTRQLREYSAGMSAVAGSSERRGACSAGRTPSSGGERCIASTELRGRRGPSRFSDRKSSRELFCVRSSLFPTG